MFIYEVLLGIKYRCVKVKKKSKDFYVYYYLVFLKIDMYYFFFFMDLIIKIIYLREK